MWRERRKISDVRRLREVQEKDDHRLLPHSSQILHDSEKLQLTREGFRAAHLVNRWFYKQSVEIKVNEGQGIAIGKETTAMADRR